MKIGIVGAGPAGLYFALLMKRANPTHQITIIEQNPPGATYGWGIVFSGRALTFLEKSDATAYQALRAHLRIWDELQIGHQNEMVAIDGSRFSGIARATLLTLLQEQCLAAGVTIHFSTPLTDLACFADCDLIVGADGINSLVRSRYADHFQPTIQTLSNKYIWYGVRQPFPALSLIFRTNADGAFVAHAYPYSHDTSTFIVECDEASWRQAGLEAMSDAESRAYCQRVFAADLQGQPLLSNKSTWLNFKAVTNQRWHYQNVVLLGDALRTVHFSIGSGTRTALEDAIVLFEALQAQGDQVEAALHSFEAHRRPTSDQLLAVAQKSYHWYEQFRDYLSLSPLDLAYSYMTRSGQVSHEKLRQQAPRFMDAYCAGRQISAQALTPVLAY
ncbi:MAG: FAD-dependent monooxygenase [Caldilineaceae bacterium]